MARTESKVTIVDIYGNNELADVLKGYESANIDEASATTRYYGFVDTLGNWIIRKIDSGASTFAKGISSYSTNWTNRTGLTYGTFDSVF